MIFDWETRFVLTERLIFNTTNPIGYFLISNLQVSDIFK